MTIVDIICSRYVMFSLLAYFMSQLCTVEVHIAKLYIFQCMCWLK